MKNESLNKLQRVRGRTNRPWPLISLNNSTPAESRLPPQRRLRHEISREFERAEHSQNESLNTKFMSRQEHPGSHVRLLLYPVRRDVVNHTYSRSERGELNCVSLSLDAHVIIAAFGRVEMGAITAGGGLHFVIKRRELEMVLNFELSCNLHSNAN